MGNIYFETFQSLQLTNIVINLAVCRRIRQIRVHLTAINVWTWKCPKLYIKHKATQLTHIVVYTTRCSSI